ncbi:MAG TPA: hypothetical protein VG389_00585 [Myxococcota bacterium]|jgi:hypothetical protein|nr:hypothetical protein [Myxococcota bacterium]
MNPVRRTTVARLSLLAAALCTPLFAGCLGAGPDDSALDAVDAAGAAGADVDSAAAALSGAPGTAVLRVAVQWGAIAGAGTDRDWSGSFVVSRGALYLHETVGFEAGKDFVAARGRTNVVQFTSFTDGDTDGLSLWLVDTEPTETLTFTYIWNGVALWSATVDPRTGASVLLNLDEEGTQMTLLAVPVQ